uniref:G protein-coupled receptor n=1 Tax=Panagrolaimus sp. PS1159 TaxID=55785 RepID=A0AC35GR74_9BILA
MKTLHKVRTTMSPKTRQLQKQISRVLFVQAFVPFVTMVIPLIFDILTINFGIYMPDYGTLFMIGLAWAPMVNPVITVTLVNQYRESVIRFLRCFSSSKVEVEHIPSINVIINQPTIITF